MNHANGQPSSHFMSLRPSPYKDQPVEMNGIAVDVERHDGPRLRSGGMARCSDAQRRSSVAQEGAAAPNPLRPHGHGTVYAKGRCDPIPPRHNCHRPAVGRGVETGLKHRPQIAVRCGNSPIRAQEDGTACASGAICIIPTMTGKNHPTAIIAATVPCMTSHPSFAGDLGQPWVG